ncbi:MAG: ubiquinone biosynthesis protein [Rickettsiales bacterium]|jgi:ubiquinone biosynthesis protein
MAILSIINLFRLFFLFLFSWFIFLFIKNKAIYFFLKNAGPTFIKLGQLLANRPDLVGKNIAESLSKFQDQLPAFPFSRAKKIIEKQLGKPLEAIFMDFGEVPVAAASIGQVHKAKTFDGKDVAVKIVRPNIDKVFKRDISTLRFLTFCVGLFSKYYREKMINILEVMEDCSAKELNLNFEAAAACEIKENLANVKGFYIPKIYWDLSGDRVLTMEWIDGIAFSDKKAILNSGFDLKKISENLVVSYFNQVYAHGLFHADMHLGNLFLMKNGDIAAIDFGITGSINKKTRIAIAEIMIAFLNKDYGRVAKLHVESGLVPVDTNLGEFALSCRIIGQSTVGKSVDEVPMARLLASLLTMTKKYNMQTKPELLLLQKTMMLVEGVGVFLDKDLNMWKLAEPFVKEWAVENIGFDAKIRDFVIEMFEKFSKN